MGGTPNYERYGRFKIEMAAKESREKKELCGEKFPRCRGTFDTCPSEEELKNLLEKKISRDDIASSLVEEFGIEKMMAVKDIKVLLKDLVREKLAVEDD